MPVHCVRLPILDVDSYFANNTEEAKAWIRSMDGDDTVVDQSQGVCATITDSKGGDHRLMACFTGGLNCVVHESVHQAWRTIQHCSLGPVSPKNHECLSYLAAWFAEEFLRLFPIPPPAPE